MTTTDQTPLTFTVTIETLSGADPAEATATALVALDGALHGREGVGAVLVTPATPPADRAAVRAEAFRDAANGAHLNVHSAAAEGVRRWLLALADGELRRLAEEAQPAEPSTVDRATVDRAMEALRAGNHITARLLLESATSSAAGARQDGPPCIPDHGVPVPCPGCEYDERQDGAVR